jgi:hypothetical protein
MYYIIVVDNDFHIFVLELWAVDHWQARVDFMKQFWPKFTNKN